MSMKTLCAFAFLTTIDAFQHLHDLEPQASETASVIGIISSLAGDLTEKCLVMGPLWSHAIRLLTNGTQNNTVDCGFIEQFYRDPCYDGAGCEMSLGCPKKTLRYYRLFKCANSNVMCNLAHVAECPLVSSTSPPKGAPILDFTFVREPLERFISAFTEIEYRTAITKVGLSTDQPYMHEELGGMQRARTFILNLLQRPEITNFTKLHNGDENLFHVFSMMGAFKRPGTVIMGDVDIGLNEGWKDLERLAGVPIPLNKDCFLHPHVDMRSQKLWSSTSDYDVRGSMGTLLAKDRSALRAFECALALPDLSCLGYPGHMLVKECEEAGFALAGFMSWESIVAEVQRVFCPNGIPWVLAM